MLTIPGIAGRIYAVVGLGKTGLATADALRRSGAKVVMYDDHMHVDDQDFMMPQMMPWERVTALVLSPGIPHALPKPHPAASLAQTHHVPIITDIELFFQNKPSAKVVGVTGTNGKSTTTALITHVLQQAGVPAVMAGNIGTPILGIAQLPDSGIYVLELSSYQLERAPSLSLDVAVFLNLSPDHLERHGSMENYCAVKERIFKSPPPEQVRIIGCDDAWVRQVYERYASDHAFKAIAVSHQNLPSCLQQVQDLNPALRGTHNAQNVAASYHALKALGFADDLISQHMKSFPGLPHRLERVAECSGVRFINDSKATNGDAAGRALHLFENIYWIAGGRPKEGGLADALPYLQGVRKAYLIGEAEDAFAAELTTHVPVSRCVTLERAVQQAFADAKSSDAADPVVLLAPACTSWDQYKSFEHRGEHFRALVAELCAKERGTA